MKRKHLLRCTILIIPVAITLVLLAGCDQQVPTQFDQWNHVISADEFSPHPTLACLVYTYEDERFNNVDYFDMHKVEADGVSDFDPVYDGTLNVFLYQPVYSNGSVTWLAHSFASPLLEGTTLRYYHVWK